MKRVLIAVVAVGLLVGALTLAKTSNAEWTWGGKRAGAEFTVDVTAIDWSGYNWEKFGPAWYRNFSRWDFQAVEALSWWVSKFKPWFVSTVTIDKGTWGAALIYPRKTVWDAATGYYKVSFKPAFEGGFSGWDKGWFVWVHPDMYASFVASWSYVKGWKNPVTIIGIDDVGALVLTLKPGVMYWEIGAAAR